MVTKQRYDPTAGTSTHPNMAAAKDAFQGHSLDTPPVGFLHGPSIAPGAQVASSLVVDVTTTTVGPTPTSLPVAVTVSSTLPTTSIAGSPPQRAPITPPATLDSSSSVASLASIDGPGTAPQLSHSALSGPSEDATPASSVSPRPPPIKFRIVNPLVNITLSPSIPPVPKTPPVRTDISQGAALDLCADGPASSASASSKQSEDSERIPPAVPSGSAPTETNASETASGSMGRSPSDRVSQEAASGTARNLPDLQHLSGAAGLPASAPPASEPPSILDVPPIAVLAPSQEAANKKRKVSAARPGGSNAGGKMKPGTSRTARNLCALDWVIANPTGTTSAFKRYWDDEISLEDKKKYQASAKATVAAN
ncbi:hypothetical protein PLICRDRAFT_180255 [Plicaturopsis crispa FD-325 SS-3]|uniref:Uncharacterized protein n=1 Tax=Plicaturopsis crispa FD-325 SS-3 TaxID=944288 RepID=A0A0C9T6D1_PLICR|nr:hypothetical protein PLICRDRAFT_180255 [Plicaturopsis crispa FD-325 SS-3]